MKLIIFLLKTKSNKFSSKLLVFIIIGLLVCLFKISFRKSFNILKYKNDDRKNKYLIRCYEMMNKYKENSFLNSFLEEISIISYDYSDKLKKDNNQIHIVTNMDNKYIYPSLISINSALMNSDKNKTTIVYHILFSGEIRRRNIDKIKSLLYLYPRNLEFIFYNMGKSFNNYKKNCFSEVTFYRLLTPIFMPVEKVIYLDSDVLIFGDLKDMYNLQCFNYYVLGFLDVLSDGVDYLGLKSDKYINAGVLLLNLDLIRKKKKYFELLYMTKNNNKLNNHDQTIINYIFYPNIGILPSKYGIFNFDSIFDIKYIYLKTIR